MGFLNNTTVTVDAILTKKGRELLAQGTEAFNITKFALADDEVDYNLWDVTHPNGTDFYGKVIENMPLLEAIPDENHVMRYKLITLPKNTIKMPVLTLSQASITFTANAGLTQPAQIVAGTTANVQDSSCEYIGCMNSSYDTYDSNYNVHYEGACGNYGCTYQWAWNFDHLATIEKELAVIAEYDDQIEMLNKYFVTKDPFKS